MMELITCFIIYVILLVAIISAVDSCASSKDCGRGNIGLIITIILLMVGIITSTLSIIYYTTHIKLSSYDYDVKTVIVNEPRHQQDTIYYFTKK